MCNKCLPMSEDHETKNETGEQQSNDLRLDDAIFEVIFRQYFIPLCAYCQYKFQFDHDLAKDTVQAALMKLWETRHTLSPGTSVKAYLYRIVINLSLDVIKHEKVKHNNSRAIQQKIASEASGDGIMNGDFRQLSDAIDRAVAELPESMRKVFVLCRFEGLKYGEVASQLNISVKTVETQMSRALYKLRRELSDYLVLFLIIHSFVNLLRYL